MDPRLFIRPPFRRCPNCEEEELGVARVGGSFVTRRCRRCLRAVRERLPEVDKNIVYLDQMAVSNIVKTLDPAGGKDETARDGYWRELFELLDRLVKLQAVVCPSSVIHEKESLPVGGFRLYQRLYEHLASGVEFPHHFEVYQRQLHHALKAWLSGETPDWDRLNRDEVLEGNLDRWIPRLRVTASRSVSEEEVDRYRRARDRRWEALNRFMDEARRAEEKTFDDWYTTERTGFVRACVEAYASYLQDAESYLRGETPISEAVWNPDVWAGMVPSLCLYVDRRRDLSRERALRTVLEFLGSEAALSAPYNEIHSSLLAGLARKAASGQKDVGRGTANDLTVVAMTVPYADAVFVDDEFAGLLAEEPIGSNPNCRANVYSNNTRDDFITYLRETLDQIPSEREETVREVYGEAGLRPFVEIIERERERR